MIDVAGEQFYVCKPHEREWYDAMRQIWTGLLAIYDKPAHIFREAQLRK